MNEYLSGLKDLYVLKDTGECVYHKTYGEEKLEADQTIMSSFLSAIDTFSANVDLGAKILETTNNRFVYHKSGEWLFIARTEKSVNPEEIADKLGKISSVVDTWIPSKWDGNVKIFQGVSTLVKELFSDSKPVHYEITGKEINNLNSVEEKIYSFLRFKGRSTISMISKLMRISELDVEKVTSDLYERKYLSSCS